MSFIGRAYERAALGAAYDDVVAGRGPRLALVGGEPGVGKTALVTETAEAAGAAGALVLKGGCTEIALAPYQAFAEALEHYAGTTHRPELLTALAPLLPRSRALTAAAEPDRYVLFNAVVRLLADTPPDQPVVLVLDDLHWADPHTIELVGHLARAESLSRVLLLGTYRDTDVVATGPLGHELAALEGDPDVLALHLRGWTEAEIAAYFETVLDERSSTETRVVGDLLAETGGNPFFVSEMVRHLLDLGIDDVQKAGVPESVREVVLARVARNGPDAMRLLATAAVMGPQFDAASLAEVAEIPLDDATDALDRAAQIVLVRKEGRGSYRFAHALVQHALYDDLSAVRRARLHGRVADLLERAWGPNAGARAGELAHHLVAEREPEDRARAAGYARQAAVWALQSLAPAEAARWYGVAAELAADEHDRVADLVGLGDSQRQAGHPEFRDTLLRAAALAADLHDDDALIAAALANNRGFASNTGGVDDERAAVLEAALVAASPNSAAHARLTALLAMELCWDPNAGPRRTALANDALAFARRAKEPALLAEVLHRRIMAVWGPSTVMERVQQTTELESLARVAENRVAEFWACFYGSTTAFEATDRVEAERRLARAVELAEEIGQPLLRWTMCVTLSWWELVHGNIVEGERLADEVLRLGASLGQADAFPIYGTLLFGVRWHQGRLAELAGLLASGLRSNPDLTVFHASYALACLDCDREADARAALLDAAAADFPSPDLVWLTTLTSWAEVAARLGEQPASERLYALLSPWAGQVVFSGAGIHGAVAHYTGLLAAALGRREEAASQLTLAAEIHERMELPFFLNRTRVALAGLQ